MVASNSDYGNSGWSLSHGRQRMVSAGLSGGGFQVKRGVAIGGDSECYPAIAMPDAVRHPFSQRQGDLITLAADKRLTQPKIEFGIKLP